MGLGSTAGTRLIFEYRSTDSASGTVVNINTDTIVNGQTTFNGNPATESLSTTTARSSNTLANSDSTTRGYYTVDTAAAQFKTFGAIVEATASGFTVTTTQRVEPFLLTRNDLNAGESFTQTYVAKTTTSVPSVVIPDQSIKSTTTFVGIEPLTVPAGTFNACRFNVSTTTGNGTATSSTWTATNTGITLRTLAGATDNVLVSGSINGTAIAP